MRGWMTAPYVGIDGGRLWRGVHECPPDVMAGGRECAPSKELPTEIEIGNALNGIRGAYGARRANGFAVQPRTALSCAAARRNASREESRGSGGPNERPCVGCDRELARP